MEFRVPIVPAVFGEMSELLGLVLIVLLVWLVVRAIRSKSRESQGRQATPEPQSEDDALRRLCMQLERMERRMANLETILMDKDEQKERAERKER